MNTRHIFTTSLLLSLSCFTACGGGEGSGSTGNDTSGGSSSSSSGGDAGAKPEPISLSSYDRSCTMDADCVLATSGDVCAPCTCPDGAINKKDQSRYQGDVAEAQKLCPPSSDGPVCGPCEEKKAACQIGVCAAVSVM